MVLASLSLPAALLREPQATFAVTFSPALALELVVLAATFVAAAGIAVLLWGLADVSPAALFLAVISARPFALIAWHYRSIVECCFIMQVCRDPVGQPHTPPP